MAFERKFPALALATTVYPASVGSLVGVQAAPSNAGRSDLKLQGAGAFYVGPYASVHGSNALLYASGQIHNEESHTGPLFVQSAAANGATVAVLAWEASM